MTRRMLLGIKERAEHSRDAATIVALGDLAGAPSARPA
jgi:hypothetical protein